MLDRDRPEQARGEGRLRRGEAARVRRALAVSRRASASRDAPPGLIPGIGPKTAERLRARRADHAGRPRRRADPSDARAAVRPAARRRSCSARARFEDDAPGHPGAQGRLRVARRRRSTATSPTRPSSRRCSPRLVGEAVRRPARAAGRRGRTIGIKVRLDDFSTHTRARTLAEPVAERRPGRPGRARAAAPVRCAAAGAAARGPRRGARARRRDGAPHEQLSARGLTGAGRLSTARRRGAGGTHGRGRSRRRARRGCRRRRGECRPWRRRRSAARRSAGPGPVRSRRRRAPRRRRRDRDPVSAGERGCAQRGRRR